MKQDVSTSYSEPDAGKKASGPKREYMQPEPEVMNRVPVSDDEIAAPALLMQKKAVSMGWEADLTYAKGFKRVARTSESKVIHTCALRLVRGDQRCYAMWEADELLPRKWRSSSAGILCLFPCRDRWARVGYGFSITQVKAYVNAERSGLKTVDGTREFLAPAPKVVPAHESALAALDFELISEDA